MSRARRDSSEVNPGNLPALPPGWCWTTLSDFADIEGGITKDQKRQRTATMREVPYLRVANVQRSYLDLKEMKTILAEGEEIETLRLYRGDIRFTEGGDRDKLGRGWVWNGEIEECIHQNHIFRARPCVPLVEPKFISLHGNFFGQHWFTKTGKQTTNLASINKGVLSRFPVPLAPLEEQRRIVAKIEELFSDLDAGVSALERVKANLKRYRAAVLQAAVTGRLTEAWRARHPDADPASELLKRILIERRRKWDEEQLARYAERGKEPLKGWQAKYKEPSRPNSPGLPDLPKGWCWATVVQLGDVQLGRQRSPKNRSRNYPTQYIRAANITEDGLDFSNIFDMEFLPSEQETYRLHIGDIVLSEASGSPDQAGKPAIWNGEIDNCCFQNTVIRFRPHGLESAYPLVVFRHYCFNKVFAQVAAGVSINHLSAAKFSTLLFPLPPLAEQTQIAAEVEQKLSIISVVERQIELNLQRAARLRQCILKRAFEGRLVPQAPTDEPAEKLLERIRQGRKPDTMNDRRNGPVRPQARSQVKGERAKPCQP